jgi:hypothetical protein
VKHKEHSIKPYSKDLSEAHEAFYKSMKDYLILAWSIKETKRKINTKDAYHVNKTQTEVYR